VTLSTAARWLVPLPVFLPLFGAGATMVLSRWRNAQRVLSISSLVGAVAAAVALLVLVERDGITTVQVCGWPAPLGITLVADLFSSLMLLVGLVTVLGVLVYAIGQPGTEQRFASFHPVYLVLAAGVSLSFLTGDLFNLFVAFELMLVASYVLITLGGTRAQVRAGMTYVVINLLASTFFVTAVAFFYGATGTVNLADLSVRIADLDPGLRTALALLLLVVFGIKAAIFPLFFWLPDSYPTASTPVTAVFAGLLTKVGVYTMVRTQTLLFPEGSRPGTVILVLASLTMVVGVLGAIAQDDVKRILSFHIVSQIGYMIFGLGLFTVAGIAGAVVFIVHQIPVKTALFMAGGLIEHAGGHSKLSRIGGLVHRAPVVAILFLLPALSLAGIPPLSGFIGKLALVQAGVGAEAWWPTAASLAAGVLTLFSMTKIWGGTFWGQPDDPVPGHEMVGRLGAPPLMIAATAGVVAVTLAIAVVAGPLWDLCLRAGEELLDPSVYVQAVLG
jgi:multicomponent Na+:H+ antiporter subunit D